MSAAEYRALMRKPGPAHRARKYGFRDPQIVLTEALQAIMGTNAVQAEVTGLVPGRKFRADIVIPSARLVIEFDGFQYHRSKAAFQKDRERQNLLVEHGWRVLRFFNAQVQSNLNAVVEEVLRVVRRADEYGARPSAINSKC